MTRVDAMSSERLWIVILACVAFLAGVAGGVLIAPGKRTAPEPSPFASYHALLSQTFDLSDGQERDLRHILDRYPRGIDELITRHIRELEPELIKLGTKYNNLIRTYVVPASEKRRFDLMAGRVPNPPATGEVPPTQ